MNHDNSDDHSGGRERFGRMEDDAKTFYGSLQRMILAILVDADDAIPAKVVRDRLEDYGADRAQSTVSTELGRLYEKDIVDREREEYPGGFRYRYSVVPDFEDEFIEDHLQAVQDVLGSGSLLTLCEMIQDMTGKDRTIDEEDLDCR